MSPGAAYRQTGNASVHEHDPARVEIALAGKTYGFVPMVDVNVNCRIRRGKDALEIEPHNNMQRYLGGKLFGLKDDESKGMNDQYRVFFGFQKEPFAQDLRIEEMMKGPAINRRKGTLCLCSENSGPWR